MKRFKKLTIYILIGVLLSSSVMLSYRKADEVKAAATLTLGTGALVMIGLLGACGLVYKGAVDSATGDYVWESALPKYEDDINELEDRFRLVWDSSVNQIASGGGYDPNDDWDGDEDKPPTWDNLVDYVSNQGMQTLFKLGATVIGSLVSAIGYAIYEESQNKTGLEKSGIILNNGQVHTMGVEYIEQGVDFFSSKTFEARNDDIRIVYGKIGGSVCALLTCGQRFSLRYGNVAVSSSYDVTSWQEAVSKYGYNYTTFDTHDYDVKYMYIDGKPYFYRFVQVAGSSTTITNKTFPIAFDVDDITEAVRSVYSDKFTWTEYSELINQENIGISSDIKINGDNGTLEPILPSIQIPTNETVGDLLGNLVIGTGNLAQTQLAVDQFVDSLQGTDPNPEGGTVPNPNPDPNPNPNPDPNPDDGEQGGEDSEEDKDNSSLLADLKNVFPFCIPFDLVNCFKLFNAEPVTPRVEIPLHFGIIDKDYTFVIDLKDFDGVAEVCRAMFLILFIVGLVLSTRSLIRG